MAEQIRACRELTRRPFAVNVVCFEWAPWAMEKIELAIAERAPVVTLSFGDPLAALARCRAADLRTIVQVQDLPGARAALAAGPDVLIVQGNEAGGHTGGRGTLNFAAQVLDLAGDVPVVIAGGIATGRGVAAALAMGAAGAAMGTRFKASREMGAAAFEKDAIVASDGSNTFRDPIVDAACGLVWPHGVTGRVLRNHFTAEWEGRYEALREQVAGYPLFGFMAELAADPERKINWAGESSGLIDRVMPAGEIVRTVMADAERHLAAIGRLVR